MIKKSLGILTLFMALNASAQETKTDKLRLDFARTYFEVGGGFIPKFQGSTLSSDEQLKTFTHSSSVNQYLTWGAFHFWGHAEFFVNFPLGPLSLGKEKKTSFRLDQSVVTGARFYPWPVREKKIVPFAGVNWGALDFKQTITPEDQSTQLSKDFLLNLEAGLLFNHKNLGLRLGVNYNRDNRWDYPLSKNHKTEVVTPALTYNLGILYSLDLSKDTKKENIEKWNTYPQLSKLSYKAEKSGDFFIGVGPSLSFSLGKSAYNQHYLPYLKDQLASKNYLDFAVGYHFNKSNLFTALSFRNPKFETTGYGDNQEISKISFVAEVNKFLTDYSGFAPFIGINVSYDHLKYNQSVNNLSESFNIKGKFEPGLSFGWDIVPGKTDEALILRTNLRWYPFSDFKVKGQSFDFRQLEYNLIQAVFYPQRVRKSK